MKRVIRICSIRLKNFKNTAYGEILMPLAADENYYVYEADVLGIYGQNGSGKTAVIEALGVIKKLLSGESLKDVPISDFIMRGCNESLLSVTFSIEHNDKRYMAIYDVQLALDEKGTGRISRETLKASKSGEGRQSSKTLIDYDALSNDNAFLPKYRYEALARKEENKVAIGVAKKISQRDMSSFIFCPEGFTLFQKEARWADYDCAIIVDALLGYGSVDLFVIPSAHSALISLSRSIPLAVRLDTESEAAAGDVPLRIDGPFVVGEEYLGLISPLMDSMNVVLQQIIPELTIGIHNYGSEIMKDGKEGARIELVSKRGDTEIALRYESEGIIKIVSILQILICVFNDPSMCMVIDELDSGIFEYLLGELLRVVEASGKGQIIFTSHNLRPLEMLDKRSIVFSTVNPENRYIRFQSVKRNNNLRDMYLRSILLGGQKEELYRETDTNKIAQAFRRAGRLTHSGE